jgi:signal peptide peptidase SppA
MPPTPHSDTGTVDEPWDAGKETGSIPNEAGKATLEKMYAYRDPKGDPDNKSSYSLPHHKVVDGKPGSANVAGVRNALARSGQVKGMSDADKATVDANLRKHLFTHNRNNNSSADQFGYDSMAGLVMVEGKNWAMHEPRLRAMCEYLAGRVVALDAEALKGAPGPKATSGVSVVSLKGIITPQPSMLSMLFGAAPGGLSSFMSDMRQAIGDADTRAVVINIDSPGGLVDMVPETAAQLRDMRDNGGKPIVAVANTTADSAAYWLASQAHEVVVTPSGEVGSVGVFMVHRNASAMFDRIGIEHTMISAGKHKTEGNPYSELDADAAAAMQQDVNDHYEAFVTDVANGRDIEMPSLDGTAFGGGRALLANRAVKAGLADKVATLGETVKRLSTHRARVARMPAASYSKADRIRLLDTLTSR